MDRKTFDKHLLRYGPDIDSWPPDDRAGALLLLAVDGAARSRLEDDQMLAGLLARAVRSAPDEAAILAGVRKRIAAADRPSPVSRLDTVIARCLSPAPMAASAFATVVLAIGLGYAMGTASVGVPDELLLAIAEGNFAGAGLGNMGDAPLWPGRS
ncbi:MAG: hypothetical protein V7704_03550 [Aurantimonas endophytica]|uniref:Uncharacterized protein n=1 Tax=Aurantimonas endophytica TaxID=1522175 RepID=A0A7W6MRC0_9HYPH|nr:hypothetical protein [Aurantimonas endophytica]MBB4004879.1 hypothetical protein [Aurantimonas endophytica]MCO6405689.1 hypothetical protein [Aurantimonas endophytica]